MTDYTKLIEEACSTAAKYEIENYYGTIKYYTAMCKVEAGEARATLQSAIEALAAERDQLQAKLDAMGKGEPVGFMSPQQLELIKDPEDESGHYIPLRKTAAGNFVMALYAAPKALAPTTWQPASNPPPESAGEVLVRMADGRCEIAWPTYWHGSSNAFAQWTFRDPDEDEQPVEWMTIPAHGIGGTP